MLSVLATLLNGNSGLQDVINIEDYTALFLLSFLLLSLVLSTLAYLYGFEEDSHFDTESLILVPFKYQMYIWTHVALLVGIEFHFQEHRLGFVITLVTLLILFYPYLRKTSPYIYQTAEGVCIRCMDDTLIVTSYLYLLGCVSNLYFGYYHCAFLCLLTCMGSVLYHRHREGKFFNLDNIFATSHVFLFAYTWHHAWQHDGSYFLLGSASLPLAIFLLVYCGDPAEILRDKSLIILTDALHHSNSSKSPSHRALLHPSKQPLRQSRALYERVHAYWHGVSALGPVLVSYYLHHHALLTASVSASSVLSSALSSAMQQELQLVVGALLASLVVNILANIAGAVPFD